MTEVKTPTGQSFVVDATSKGDAVAKAREQATGPEYGQALHVEEVDPGRWEVVFQVLDPVDIARAVLMSVTDQVTMAGAITALVNQDVMGALAAGFLDGLHLGVQFAFNRPDAARSFIYTLDTDLGIDTQDRDVPVINQLADAFDKVPV